MAEFYFDNLAKNLPDAYRKDADSNNYKILEVERTANNHLREVLEQIENILDINNAKGATLDMYGKRFGQARGTAKDAQYLAMIKSKIMRSLCNGSYKDIVDAICYTFNCNIDEVLIEEKGEAVVSLEKIPLSAIINSGFSAKQAEQIIKALIPAGVELQSVLYEGTFEFGETEYEYDESAGFSEAEDGEIGGYLGWTGSQENISELPI